MTDRRFHPFSLEVQALASGAFAWAIRKDGKLMERSDRNHRSEADAVKSGEKAIERHLGHGGQNGR